MLDMLRIAMVTVKIQKFTGFTHRTPLSGTSGAGADRRRSECNERGGVEPLDTP